MFRLALSCAILVVATACHSLADLEIQYEPCVRPPTPYVEQFEDGRQAIVDRCWKSENIETENRKISVDEDLIMSFSDDDRDVPLNGAPPMLVRRLEGDFVMAVKVEAVTTRGDFCGMKAGDGAGLVVQSNGADSGAPQRAAFLVRPYLQEEGGGDVDCSDRSENANQPSAIAEATSPPMCIKGIGYDAEADIAVCRKGGALSYFYRDSKKDPDEPDPNWSDSWQNLTDDCEILGADAEEIARENRIGSGPVDVGLTTVRRTDSVQGVFNWVVLVVEGDIHDDCKSELQDLEAPGAD